MTATIRFADVRLETNVPCVMRDGTVLYADIYRPDAPDPLPVLLMRQPYGKRIASTITYAHPVWYAKQGYNVIVQDVRGRGESEGEFEPFVREAEDGYDTVEWAASLPYSNGQVGMYGFSYQGLTQWAAAAANPPHLKAIAPAMCGADLYRGMFYPHGRLALAEHLPWAFQLARDTARRRGDAATESFCSAVRRRTPDDLTFRMPVGGEHPVLTSYFPEFYEWCGHTEYDGYWEERNWLPQAAASPVPTLQIGGWYDIFLMGTMQSYEAFRQREQSPERFDRLIVGPWDHIPWGRRAGGVDHGPSSDGDIHTMQLSWFDYWLKGKRDTDWHSEPHVRYFELGSNRWRTLNNASPFGGAAELKKSFYYIGGSGKPANGVSGGGGLLTVTEREKPVGDTVDAFVYDGRQPMPLDSYLPVDRSAVEDRYELLVYTSEPFGQPLQVFGSPRLKVLAQSAFGATDLVAVLTVVEPGGSSRFLSIGRVEIGGEETSEDGWKLVDIEMKPIAIEFQPGTAVRLELTGSAFPFFVRHPNGVPGSLIHSVDDGKLSIATVAVKSSQDRPASLELPII